MTRIRPFRPGDEAALAEICVKTGDAGADATGIFDDDSLWGEIFVLPYASRYPEYAFVVEADEGRVVGYLVAAADTRAFEDWFHDVWWPARAARWPLPETVTSRQDATLTYAYGRIGGAETYGDRYPAHLHIDLLPELQGQGWGRALIETLIAALRADGVTGVHLVASGANTGALAFYERLGFARLASPPDSPAFGMAL